MKKVKLVCVVMALVMLIGVISGCAGGTGGGRRDNVPVAIQDFEFFWDESGGEAVFWFTNNSNYTIDGSFILVATCNDTGEMIVSRYNGVVAPGATSPRGTVMIDFIDDEGYWRVEPVSLAVAENSEKSHLTFSYNDDDGGRFHVRYDFITGVYSDN